MNRDRDMMDGDDTESPEKENPTATGRTANKVSVMFQKILSLGTSSGQVIVKVGEDPEGELHR